MYTEAQLKIILDKFTEDANLLDTYLTHARFSRSLPIEKRLPDAVSKEVPTDEELDYFIQSSGEEMNSLVGVIETTRSLLLAQ